jgi:hypothetical protein
MGRISAARADGHGKMETRKLKNLMDRETLFLGYFRVRAAMNDRVKPAASLNPGLKIS